MSHKYVVVDLETTGNSAKKGDRIIQVGAVIIENGKITGEYSSLVNPGKPVPPFIEELTGINDEMLKDAPTFSMIADDLAAMLEDSFFVAHNVLFDLGFLQEELLMAGKQGYFGQVLDTVELARILYPSADGYKLADLAAREGIVHERPHQADSDAYVTAELLLIMLDKLRNIPPPAAQQLLKLSAGLKSDIYMLLDEICTRHEQCAWSLPPHLELYRGIVLRRKAGLVAEKKQIPSFPETDEAKINILKRGFSQFEPRKGQLEMMDAVHMALETKEHLLLEAGTGIGKTIAYLLPASCFSAKTGKRVVISTYTTQLQHQLIAKDLPVLEEMLPGVDKPVLLKGRDHYLNLAKFEQSLAEDDDNYDTALTKMQILVWLLETETGDYDELNLSSGGNLYWNKVKSGQVTFLQSRPWKEREFYEKARNAAAEAKIIITNHALLLSDLAAVEKILPEYDFAIIDEAHQFEKAAGRIFGETLDFLHVRILLNQLGQYENGQLFYKLETLVKRQGMVCHTETSKINEWITGLQLEAEDLFRAASAIAGNANRQSGFGKIQARFDIQSSGRVEKALLASAERFMFMLRDVLAAINERSRAAAECINLSAGDKSLLEEIAGVVSDLDEVLMCVRKMVSRDQTEKLFWVETDPRSAHNFTTIHSRSYRIAEKLNRLLFNKKESVILTSATLTVQNSFLYIKKELGLAGTRVKEQRIPSPFRYHEQVQLMVPNDLPAVNTGDDAEYIAAIAEHIISIAEATAGRMLVLFTSHEMLRNTYGMIKESGLLEEYVLIAQGITAGSRSRLTRNFQKFEKAILFGTSSFWEGVDIPGEDLSCLIMVRLPFSHPEDPLTQAKSEQIEHAGGNPFSELALPEAVLRFKQGFGRLIRTASDRGIVIVFDRRVVTTQYGKAFIQSIPSVPLRQAGLNEILEMIRKWLQ